MFHTCLLHIVKAANNEEEDDVLMEKARHNIDTLRQKLEDTSAEYNELRMDVADLERETRSVAQTCLRYENHAKVAVQVSREIEMLSERLSKQDRTIRQLRERLERLETPISSPTPVQANSRRGSNVSITEIGNEDLGFCKIIQKLSTCTIQ